MNGEWCVRDPIVDIAPHQASKMASSYGARHGLPGYDKFRTGCTYRNIFDMLRDELDDPREWKYKSRGVILGMWHQIKLELYERACANGYVLYTVAANKNAHGRGLAKMSGLQKTILEQPRSRGGDLRPVRKRRRAARG
jgi:hypothetical protein